MVEDVLVGGAALDEGRRPVGCQNIIPQIDELMWNGEAQQALADNADVVESGHQLAVVLGHRRTQQVPAIPLLQQLNARIREKEDRGYLVYAGELLDDPVVVGLDLDGETFEGRGLLLPLVVFCLGPEEEFEILREEVL